MKHGFILSEETAMPSNPPEGRTSPTGFTLVEILVAIILIGIVVLPLLDSQSRALDGVNRTLLLQQASLIAETAANSILARGYSYYESGAYMPEDERFTCKAEFWAEEIAVPEIFEVEEEETEIPVDSGEEDEGMLAVYHIKVAVTSVEDETVRVELSLDLPGETADIEGADVLLPSEAAEEADE